MSIFKRTILAGAALALMSGEAMAGTSVVGLTSTWVDVAPAGSAVQIQSQSGAAQYTTSVGAPSGGSSGTSLIAPDKQFVFVVTGDLWVKGSGNLTVTTGIATGGSGGSLGTDYSANAVTLPNIGANFAASGPYASYVLIKTVPAGASRNLIDVENVSGAQIALVRDDGTAASGAAPVNASVFPLGGGSNGVGSQGGSFTSSTFKGRLQIYAPSAGAVVTVLVD